MVGQAVARHRLSDIKASETKRGTNLVTLCTFHGFTGSIFAFYLFFIRRKVNLVMLISSHSGLHRQVFSWRALRLAAMHAADAFNRVRARRPLMIRLAQSGSHFVPLQSRGSTLVVTPFEKKKKTNQKKCSSA